MHFLQGSKSNYLLELTSTLSDCYAKYKEVSEADPFAEDTIAVSKELVSALKGKRNRSW